MERPYESYVYAYPHKTAYRPLKPEPPLSKLWQGEDRGSLSFYAHIPFCEVRCGFCNLFTRTGAPEGLSTAYLDALERQAAQTAYALNESGEPPNYATAAIGGGTPTYFDPAELTRLFDIVEKTAGVRLGRIGLSVEASPSTATPDRLAVLAERGTTRLSLGVQSFDEGEARSAVRPQKSAEVERALDAIREARIPVLNLDLIYGIDGQTGQSWIRSLEHALNWRPEEIYLYPLYVRPLTGLDRIAVRGAARSADHPADHSADRAWDKQRLGLYQLGRDYLLGSGYEQVSMRMFRRADALPAVPDGDDYSCQSDGMVGLGCGARSYTRSLHYSFDYAVSAHEIRGIIDDYVATEDFSRARVGIALDAGERRRRHFIQSLLQAQGVDEDAYFAAFGTAVRSDFAAELAILGDRGFLAESPAPRLSAQGPALRLSAEGLAWSDAIGPLLFSDSVRAAMRAYELR